MVQAWLGSEAAEECIVLRAEDNNNKKLEAYFDVILKTMQSVQNRWRWIEQAIGAVAGVDT